MRHFDASDSLTRHLVTWGERREDVRAMLLTSTRAVPDSKLDALSDHDVILVVRSIVPFVTDRDWIGDFGEVLVAYWDPVEPDSETGIEQSGNIVQYADGHKIDFSLWPIAQLERIVGSPTLPAELDAGYLTLIDKDGLADRLRSPTYRAYVPAKPDEATYLTNVNDFFIGPPYVAKCLLRDELLPAKWCLDYDMRDVYLRPMLEWRMECDHDWSATTGALGKGLKRRLPPELWSELENTYAGAGIDENWESLFRLMAFYRRVAREVATHLGYEYLVALDERVTEFVRQMRLGRYGRP